MINNKGDNNIIFDHIIDSTINVTNVLNKSTDYLAIVARINEKKEQLRYIDAQFIDYKNKLSIEIEALSQELEDYKKEVLILSRQFQNIEINSERLKIAKAYFDEGNLSKAEACLNTNDLEHDLKKLKEQQSILSEDLKTNDDKLKHLATQFLLKAQLITVDSYNNDNGERISPLIEKALEASSDFDILHGAALAYSAIGYKDKAITCYEGAIKTGFDIPKEVIVPLYYNLGTLYYKRDNAKSQKYLEEMLAICEHANIREPETLTVLANGLHNLSNVFEGIDIVKQTEILQKAIEVRIKAALENNAYYCQVSHTLNRLSKVYLNLDDVQKLADTVEKSLKYLELFIASEPAIKITTFHAQCLWELILDLNALNLLYLKNQAIKYKYRLDALLFPFEIFVNRFHPKLAYDIARAFEEYIRFSDSSAEELSSERYKKMYEKMIYYYKESFKYKHPDDQVYGALGLGSILLAMSLISDENTAALAISLAHESIDYFNKIIEPDEQYNFWKENAESFLSTVDTCECEKCMKRRSLKSSGEV